jgi:HSP20 family protein
MSVSQLIPWARNRASHLPREARDPLVTLHREMNRLFDDVWRQFDTPNISDSLETLGNWPSVELNEGDKDVVLTAELPGMDEKDIEILFVDQSLVIRGERRAERQDANQHMSERYYGRFERRIPLTSEIEADKAKAIFRNGVLTVTLPKTAKAQKETVHIPVGKVA